MALSVFQMFKIGIGPSSSHTVGPMKAAKEFLLNAKRDKVLDTTNIRQVKTELFGSLALTGKGHATDKALIMGLIGEDPDTVETSTIYDKVNKLHQLKRLKLLNEKEVNFTITFQKSGKLPYHTNGMRFTLINDKNEEIYREVYYSIGGGFIVNEKDTFRKPEDNNYSEVDMKVPYPFKTADELFIMARENNLSIPELMMANEKCRMEEKEILKKLDRIWEVMSNCITRGINSPGILPGPLKIERRAPKLFTKLTSEEFNTDLHDPMTFLNWINCWALAVSEENSIGGQVVTAPTNGSAGVVPAVIAYYNRFHSIKHPQKIHDFLLTAAAVGMIIKMNATVSGAEGGCQAEIGASSSMAAAGLTCALGGDLYQIENAAEIALEHFIGLTCDPVGGVVQIPCIERNAVGAVKSVNASALSLNESNKHKISLDRIIKVMKITGDDMKTKYKETSKGGIAKIMEEDFKSGLKLLKTKDRHEKGKENDVDLFMHNTLC